MKPRVDVVNPDSLQAPWCCSALTQYFVLLNISLDMRIPLVLPGSPGRSKR